MIDLVPRPLSDSRTFASVGGAAPRPTARGGRRPRFALVLPILLVFSGCASMAGLVAPDVSVVGLQLEDLTLLESTGTLTVRLVNENPEPLVVDGAAFKVRLEGIRVGNAVGDERVEIPRLSSATVPLELYVSHVAVGTRLPRILEQGTIDWEVRGKVWIERPWGRSKMRIEKSGRIDLDAPPPQRD